MLPTPCAAQAVIAAFEGGNADAFVEAVAEYDRISKLNPWRVAYVVKSLVAVV